VSSPAYCRPTAGSWVRLMRPRPLGPRARNWLIGSGVIGVCFSAGPTVLPLRNDTAHLANTTKAAKAAPHVDEFEAVADRGYFDGEEILACDRAGITVTLPKRMTSGAKSEGRFGKQDFVYLAACQANRSNSSRISRTIITGSQKQEEAWTRFSPLLVEVASSCLCGHVAVKSCHCTSHRPPTTVPHMGTTAEPANC
jgi:hypothetical protein